MDPIYCARCDDAEVASDGAICPRCVEQMNEDAGIDARARLARLREAHGELEEEAETHGYRCLCPLCHVRIDLWTVIRSVQRPGFDSLWAEEWAAKGFRLQGIQEATP